MTLKIILLDQKCKEFAKRKVDEAGPGYEVIIRPVTKTRSSTQNAAQWAGLLKDFSTQVCIDGHYYSPDEWHDELKKRFLPDHYEPGKTLEGYVKWKEQIDGSLKCVGSTTKLTKSGFSDYMEQCYHYGAERFSIRFTTNEY